MRNELSALALLLALSGCGGGSSGSTGGGTNGPVTVAPAPTPSPAPTPTPAPAASYATGFDFTKDRQFETVGGQVQIIDRPLGGQWVFDRATSSLMNTREHNSAQFDHAGSAMLFKVAAHQSTYPGTLLELSQTDYLRWLHLQPETINSLIVSRWPASDYVVLFKEEEQYRFDDGGIMMRSTIERWVLGGSYTLVSDHPTSGSKSYLVGVTSTSVTRDGAMGFTANATVQMNFAGNSFSATIPAVQISSVNGNAPVEATLQLSGTLDSATGRLEGTITSAEGIYSGHFAGAFFGPQAAEIGIGFVVVKNGGFAVAGFIGTNGD